MPSNIHIKLQNCAKTHFTRVADVIWEACGRTAPPSPTGPTHSMPHTQKPPWFWFLYFTPVSIKQPRKTERGGLCVSTVDLVKIVVVFTFYFFLWLTVRKMVTVMIVLNDAVCQGQMLHRYVKYFTWICHIVTGNKRGEKKKSKGPIYTFKKKKHTDKSDTKSCVVCSFCHFPGAETVYFMSYDTMGSPKLCDPGLWKVSWHRYGKGCWYYSWMLRHRGARCESLFLGECGQAWGCG